MQPPHQCYLQFGIGPPCRLKVGPCTLWKRRPWAAGRQVRTARGGRLAAWPPHSDMVRRVPVRRIWQCCRLLTPPSVVLEEVRYVTAGSY